MLHEDPVAKMHHTVGLSCAAKGEYVDACTSFNSALAAIKEKGDSTLNTRIYAGRILADCALAEANLASEHDRPDWLNLAEDTAEQAAAITGRLVSGLTTADAKTVSEHEVPDSRRLEGELFAQHGRALGVLGRLGTLGQVMNESDDPRQAPVPVARGRAKDHERYYRMAYRFSNMGNNGHERVVAAMTYARQERISGSRDQAAAWLGKAAWGVGWTLARNPRHFGPAVKDFFGLTWSLRSPSAARASVRQKP